MLSSASDKVKSFARDFSNYSNFDDSGIFLHVFPSRTNLKLHNISMIYILFRHVSLSFFKARFVVAEISILMNSHLTFSKDIKSSKWNFVRLTWNERLISVQLKETGEKLINKIK